MRITRRRLLENAATFLPGRSLLAASPDRVPRRRARPEHVVVVTMENRSFDHLLGWVPGADGRQAGLSYLDRAGVAHETHALAPDFQGCGHPDPDHSYEGGRIEFAGGACDGWLRAGSNDAYAIGYYTGDDLPFLGRAALDWTVCDRYFSATMGPTFPNRLYLNAAATDRLSNTGDRCLLATIWDRLAGAGLEGRYYAPFLEGAFLTLWGDKYRSVLRPLDGFARDCAAGDLPHLAFLDAPSAGESTGESLDDHPFGDVRAGDAFLAGIYRAVTTSPAWPRTLLVVTFDEWGGFFDHVPPAEAPDADPRTALRGFRVPCVLISPWTRGGRVVSRTFDHASILKMVESRWRLAPLSPRDAAANDLAEALGPAGADLDLDAPVSDVPPLVSPRCP